MRLSDSHVPRQFNSAAEMIAVAAKLRRGFRPPLPREQAAPASVTPAAPKNISNNERAAQLTPCVDYCRARKTVTQIIIEAVCQHYQVDAADLKSASRKAVFVRPRQIAMYLVRNVAGKSQSQTAKAFGGRDHTTVLHADRKIAALIETDAKLNNEISEIKAIVEKARASNTDTMDA